MDVRLPFAVQGLVVQLSELADAAGGSGGRVRVSASDLRHWARAAGVAAAVLRAWVDEPIARALRGERLGETEYYALRAIGFLPNYQVLAGVSGVGEFETFDLLHYQDDGIAGFLLTDRMRASRDAAGGLPLELRPVLPGDARRSWLRPEQEEFLRERFHAELQRMRR